MGSWSDNREGLSEGLRPQTGEPLVIGADVYLPPSYPGLGAEASPWS